MDSIADFLKNRIHSGFRPIVIHSLDDAKVALQIASELGTSIALISGAAPSNFGGVGWFKAVVDEASKTYPNVSMTAILDCRDNAGDVMEALRAGIKHVCFTGSVETTAKLQSMANKMHGKIHSGFTAALDLRNTQSPTATCRKWLEAGIPANQDIQFPVEQAV